MIIKNVSKSPIVLTYDPNWDDQKILINDTYNKAYTLQPTDRTILLCPGFDPSDLTEADLIGLIFSSDPKAEDDFYQFQMGGTDKKVFGITDLSKSGTPKFKMECKSADQGSCIIELS